MKVTRAPIRRRITSFAERERELLRGGLAKAVTLTNGDGSRGWGHGASYWTSTRSHTEVRGSTRVHTYTNSVYSPQVLQDTSIQDRAGSACGHGRDRAG